MFLLIAQFSEESTPHFKAILFCPGRGDARKSEQPHINPPLPGHFQERRRTMRENAGFMIIASKTRSDGVEVVMGFNPKTTQYVTWHCHNGNDYYYGHYGYEFEKAAADFIRRSGR